MSTPQAFFLPSASPGTGQRLCLFHPAEAERPRGRVVYVHPLGEEMNKSRRMAALTARALARAGFSVLQIDLLGCGDSSGDFADASWQAWVDDVLLAEQWLRQRDASHARAPLWLWGLRAGCLVAAEAAARIEPPSNFCFWQPSAAGKLLLQQFLRLRLAAQLQSGQSKALMQQLREQLDGGQTVEIAGYRLAAGLARGLEAARLSPPPQAGSGGRLEWLELHAQEGAALSPVSTERLEAWRAAGLRTRARLVQGPQFWQTSEIETAPALLEATVAALLDETVTA